MRISDWSSDVCSSDLGDMARSAACACKVPAHGAEFVGKLRERREVEVAFQQRRPPPVHAVGLGQQRPDRIGHGGAMGVDLQVGRFVAVAGDVDVTDARRGQRSEEHTSELQSLMRISYAVFCLKKKKK